MAISPNDGETFVREVDEELRRERVNTIIARYGWAILAAILLILAAIGGFIWWKNHKQEQAAQQGEALLEAIDSMESGNRNAANAKIDRLASSEVEGYRAAALFARATAQSEANNNAAAIATLRSIASNGDFAEPYRQAALIRQTELEFDRLQPQQVIRRLSPLTRPGSAWLGTAGEMVGIAHLRMRRPDLAGPLFARIGRDETVPPSIRTRAIQMAGSLGINAMPETPAAPGAASNAGAPQAPEAREKGE
ncbi:MAG TPA: tetratricopeptide repeat protein [Allosphingosinicella sp.]|nr:tetratricopeptide repeat protein [Allosphingosinicella sp.]